MKGKERQKRCMCPSVSEMLHVTVGFYCKLILVFRESTEDLGSPFCLSCIHSVFTALQHCKKSHREKGWVVDIQDIMTMKTMMSLYLNQVL